MLRDGQDYHDLGAAHFQRVDHARLVAGFTRPLHHLGYEVIPSVLRCMLNTCGDGTRTFHITRSAESSRIE